MLELINFIKDKAMSAAEAESLVFTSQNNQKPKLSFGRQ